MTRQIRIVHHTGYSYPENVLGSHNEVRMTPRSTREQWVINSRIDIQPNPWVLNYTDYWHAPGSGVADFVFEGVALGLVVLGLGVLLGLSEALDDGNALPRLVIASPPRLTATPATTMAAIRLTSTPAIHHAPGCCRFASERAAGDAAADAGRPCPPAMPTGAGWV